jgi:hypothetical protein
MSRMADVLERKGYAFCSRFRNVLEHWNVKGPYFSGVVQKDIIIIKPGQRAKCSHAGRAGD